METVVSISALFVSIAALYLVIRFRKELSLSEQVSNTTRHIYDEYSKRKLDPPIKFRNKRYKNLEEIRHLIRRSKREDKFDEISSDSGWHKFSWEISLAMQHVGLLILPDIACMIVTDWNYCSKLIEENRKGNPILIDSKKSGNPIYFTRRHAEWLAFAAAVYLHNY